MCEVQCWRWFFGNEIPALSSVQAGGRVSSLRGEPFSLTTRPVLASNGKTHDAILSVLDEAGVHGLDPE
jgi:hypothetical protein